MKQRVHLSLKKKVEVIETSRKYRTLTLKALGDLFGCSKMQIGKILKNKESILASYGANDSGESAYRNSRSSEYAEVNEVLYEWYKLACSKNIYPGGAQLTEKAKEIAVRLGKPKFSGSNGWLQKWKVRYNIKQVTICGESGDIRGDTVESWKERLPELLRGFSREDIWNLDETGCFWKALPDRGFGQKGKQCKGGKKK